MDGQRVIWSLPEVTRFVHSGDYFLLWRGRTFMGEVEVWRYVTPPSSSSTTTKSTVTGNFALYVTLPTLPGGWRNYAFRAPLLALVNPHQGHLVHLFELPPTPPLSDLPSESPPTPTHLQAIRLIDLDMLLTTHSSIPDPAERHMLVFSVLLDLQISDKYLCACFDTGLVIARLRTDIHEEEDGESTGKGKATADAQRGQVRKDAIMLEATGQPDDDRRRMPTAQHVFREKRPSTPLTSSSSLPAAGIKYRVRTGWGVMGESMVKERTKEEIEKEESENSNALVRSSYRWNPNFISAQFSPNGKHLVAGTTFRCIYLFTDLDRIFDSAGVSPRDIVQKIAMEEPVRYLKWDTHDTVFALRDDENETWLFDLCPTYHAHPNSHPPDESFDDPLLRLVGARALKVGVFGQPRPFVHGLQVRKTGVWAMSDLDLVLNRRADVASGASVSREYGVPVVYLHRRSGSGC
ncbi:hypothetical protein BC629DRAFT_621364 [Irpex lacteus]|nr:hypothetical protein BC629DRAFT_621364 [Irpex lacteus]